MLKAKVITDLIIEQQDNELTLRKPGPAQTSCLNFRGRAPPARWFGIERFQGPALKAGCPAEVSGLGAVLLSFPGAGFRELGFETAGPRELR